VLAVAVDWSCSDNSADLLCCMLQLRREGMRLFLIWYEVLMDNATDECHKMFQSLVPKIGSTENSEFDLFTVKTFRECEFRSMQRCLSVIIPVALK